MDAGSIASRAQMVTFDVITAGHTIESNSYIDYRSACLAILYPAFRMQTSSVRTEMGAAKQ